MAGHGALRYVLAGLGSAGEEKEEIIMEENKKLIIHCAKPLTAKEANTVRAVVPNDTLNELRELSEKTGYPMSSLTRILIEYALSYVEIKE